MWPTFVGINLKLRICNQVGCYVGQQHSYDKNINTGTLWYLPVEIEQDSYDKDINTDTLWYLPIEIEQDSYDKGINTGTQ